MSGLLSFFGGAAKYALSERTKAADAEREMSDYERKLKLEEKLRVEEEKRKAERERLIVSYRVPDPASGTETLMNSEGKVVGTNRLPTAAVEQYASESTKRAADAKRAERLGSDEYLKLEEDDLRSSINARNAQAGAASASSDESRARTRAYEATGGVKPRTPAQKAAAERAAFSAYTRVDSYMNRDALAAKAPDKLKQYEQDMKDIDALEDPIEREEALRELEKELRANQFWIKPKSSDPLR